MVNFLSGKTGLSLTAIGCMDSHRSTSSSKRSRNQSELLAGIHITNLEPSLSKRSSFSRAEEKLKEFKAPSIRYSDNIRAMQLESYGLCSSRRKLKRWPR